MKSATMLYRLGSKEIIWGTPMDTVVVDWDDVESHLNDGWFLHPNDVKSPPVKLETVSVSAGPIAESEQDKPRRGRPPKVKE